MPAESTRHLIDEILASKRSVRAWEQLMEMVLQLEPVVQDQEVQYILNHKRLKKWDSRYRICPDNEWEKIRDSKTSPAWWPLVKHLDFTSSDGRIGPLFLLETIASLNIQSEQVVTLESLALLKQLQHLRFVESEINFSFKEVSALINLQTLTITLSGLADVKILAPLVQLEVLDLSNCHDLIDISAIHNLQKLHRLVLKNCEELRDVSVVKDLPNLKYLDVSGCVLLEDLSNISNQSGLKIIR